MTVTVRGIRIRATPGWVVTYLLLVATLVLWRDIPGSSLASDVERALAIILVPLVLLPTVVAHEIAHLVVARRLGSRTRDIDLRVVGMSRGPGSATGDAFDEARIALAGPVVSLALGLVLLGATIVLEGGAGPSALVAWIVGCVAVANLVLGLASLYPGYPMDGSDVVHAIAWRATGSRRSAARVVVQAGVMAGWGVMLLGLGVALRVDPTAGMWLTLLGWSLGRVARHAREQDRAIELVAGLTVADATERDVAVVSPTLTLDTVVTQHRLTDGPGMFPVVRAGALVGVIDMRDVGRAGRSGTQVRVADRMRSIDRVRVVTEGQYLWDALVILDRDRVNAVPVVAPGDRARLLGLVTRPAVQRLLRARARRVAAEDAVDRPPGVPPPGVPPPGVPPPGVPPPADPPPTDVDR